MPGMAMRLLGGNAQFRVQFSHHCPQLTYLRLKFGDVGLERGNFAHRHIA